jgi:hypothetical protein
MANPADDIENASLVLAKFRTWPAFHDAEVTRLALARTGRRMELDLKVPFESAPLMVVFVFHDIADVFMEGFNEQNSIFQMTFDSVPQGIRVDIDPNYGLAAHFVCGGATVVSVEDAEQE